MRGKSTQEGKTSIRRIITFNEHRCLCRWSFLATCHEHEFKNTSKKPLGQVKHLMEVLDILISIVSLILACHDELNSIECGFFSHTQRQNVKGGIVCVSLSCLFSFRPGRDCRNGPPTGKFMGIKWSMVN